MDQTQERLKYLIGQYAKGTASDLEEDDLYQLIDNGQNDEQFHNIMLNMLMAESPSDINKEQLDAIFKRILDEDKTRHLEQTPAKKGRIISWQKLAVAASIIVIFGVGLIYYTGRETPSQSVQSSQTLVVKDVAAPASSNAVLTLANGQIIVLDSAGNGTVARQGDVQIIKLADGQIAYNPQAQNQTPGLIMYNTLTNPAGSKMVNITLEDGTKVWLNSKSSLRYPTAFTGKHRNVEITGEAYFEVSQRHLPTENGKSESIDFQVKANGVNIQVLGTHFNINSYDEEGSVRTTLLEGSVRVHKGDKSAKLNPGQQAQVNLASVGKGKDEIKINRPDLEEVMAWKNGRFAFQNTELETIMRQMARWYNVEVIYETKINDRYTVNVNRDVPVSQLFKFIEMAGGVHFEVENNKVIVGKEKN